MAFERVSGPIDNSRGDIHAAIVAKTLVDVNSGEDGNDIKLTDFIPEWGKSSEEKTGFDPDNIDTTREVTESDGGFWPRNPG